MLGFILSKLNLLILVTAIFAIIGFFTIGLTDITKVNEARELAFKVKEKAFALASAPGFCISDSQVLPDELIVAGGNFYYVMAVSKKELPDNVNLVIFSVYPRKDIEKYYAEGIEPNAIAADSFRTKAEVKIYSYDYDGVSFGSAGTGIEERTSLDEKSYIDPQAINYKNTIEIIKEVENGQPKLYILICTDAICKADKTTIGERDVHQVNAATGEGGFKC
ncbi:MAG: hypothetical protein NUV57_02390 [archaeon]|nr:hypothetical protein [archaeon]